MMSIDERLDICEALMAGRITIEEARRQRASILRRSRRGRVRLWIERASGVPS
jgi:hypothetical protein